MAVVAKDPQDTEIPEECQVDSMAAIAEIGRDACQSGRVGWR